MLSYRAVSFAQGVLDGVGLWKIGSSKTLRGIVLKVLPLYAISIAVGAYFMTALTWFVSNDVSHQLVWQTLWLIGWGAPAYVVCSLLQLRFAWVVTSIIATLQPALAPSGTPTSALIAEGLYGVALSVTYLSQTYLYCLLATLILPSAVSSVAAGLINVAMIAWATSFAAFECKLIVQRRDLFQRIKFLETRWSYALGYGLPASLVYHFFPGVFATSAWQCMQLLLTLRAVSVVLPDAPPINAEARPAKVCDWFGPRLRIFRLAQDLAMILIRFVNDLTS